MIKDYRARFPKNLVLLQAECDMVAAPRRFHASHRTDAGDRQALEDLAAGPACCGLASTRRSAERAMSPQAYTEALERNPRQLDVRILLGQTKLRLSEPDEALRQAKLVLDVDKNRPDAVLLQAQALAEAGSTAKRAPGLQKAAIAQLKAAVAANPHSSTRFTRWPRSISSAMTARPPRRSEGRARRPTPRTPPAASRLVEMLLQPLGTGRQAGPRRTRARRKRVAAELAADDQKGSMILAVAVGFHQRQAARSGTAITPRPPRPSSTRRPLTSTSETCCSRSPRASPIQPQAKRHVRPGRRGI